MPFKKLMKRESLYYCYLGSSETHNSQQREPEVKLLRDTGEYPRPEEGKSTPLHPPLNRWFPMLHLLLPHQPVPVRKPELSIRWDKASFSNPFVSVKNSFLFVTGEACD